MRAYFLAIGLVGVAVGIWAAIHYRMPLPLAVDMGFVPGTVAGIALAGRRR
jgi:hydrogenase/urease accessory protein HupE